MNSRFARAFGLGLSAVFPLGCVDASAQGNLSLPEITVNAPSPIRSGTAATDDGLQGTLPVVTDQFATVTVVPTEEIRRSPGATLGELLSSKPGISSSGYAPGAAARPIVRGLDNNGVRIQENGLDVGDVSNLGEDHGVPIDPLGARQIEVIRGPATLRYGSQAIGGVINADNNRIPTALPQRGFAAELNGAVSTVDSGREGSVLLDAGKGNVAVHADAYGRSSDDYRIPAYPYRFPPNPAPQVNGRQPNSAARADGQAIGGSYLFDGGFVGVAVSQFGSLYHVPSLEGAASGTRIDMHQTKVTSKGEFRPQGSAIDTVRFWLGATDYRHDELGTENGVDGVQQTFTNMSQEARVEVQLQPFDLRFASLTTALGVQGTHQRLASPGAEGGLFDPNSTRSIAAYIFNELKFTDTLRMQLSGRIESVKVTGAAPDFPVDFLPAGADPASIGRNPGFTPKSAAIGLLRDLPLDLVGSITAQHVERAPRAAELFSRGPHDATGTFDIGNPNLRIESANSLEADIRRRKGPFRFEATAYVTKFSGFIYRNLNGNTCDGDFASCVPAGAATPGELDQAVYFQRDALFRGAELQFQWDAMPLGGGFLGIDGQYDIVRATFSDGTNVPRMPPQRLGGSVYFRNEEWFARIGLLHGFAQNRIAPTETETPGYDLLRAEVSRTVALKNDPLGLRQLTYGVVGNNLLNQAIRNSTSFLKDEVLLPGANVRLFASVRY